MTATRAGARRRRLHRSRRVPTGIPGVLLSFAPILLRLPVVLLLLARVLLGLPVVLLVLPGVLLRLTLLG